MNRHLTDLRLTTFLVVIFASACTTGKGKKSSGESSSPAVPTTTPLSSSVTENTDDVDVLDDYATAEIADPLEKLNRVTFKFNDGLYRFVFRPISKGYTTIAPKPVRKGIDNVYDNLRFPVRLVNSTLQGKFKRAGLEVQKFGLNTVIGVGGIFKVSDRIEKLATVPEEDTAQTFAVWGIGKGAYLVIPVFGPSTIRDAWGLAGDYALNPINWGLLVNGSLENLTWIPTTANTIRLMPSQLDIYDAAKANSIDPYLSVRSIYLQNRKSLEED